MFKDAFKEVFMNLVAPKACIICDDSLKMETEIQLCDECRAELPFIKGTTCAICGIPISDTYVDIYCGRCKSKKYRFESNISVFEYKDDIKEALKRMKFGNRETWIAETAGKLLAIRIKEKYERVNFDCIINVPCSLPRRFRRGFDQSAMIADVVSEILGIEMYDDVLYKIKNNRKQSTIEDAKEREKNVRGAYEIYRYDKIIDKTVLLIDDIFTTGSTINECARMLKNAGASIVYTATVAISMKD